MQISELNKDLLSVLTGRTEDKSSGIKAVAGDFSGLLQSVRDGKSVGGEKTAAVDGYRQKMSAVEVKEGVNADKRTSVPEKTNKASEEKTSSPVKKEKNKKISDNCDDSSVPAESAVSQVDLGKETVQSPAADGVAETAESENIAVEAENIVLSQPVAPEIMTDVADNVVEEAGMSVESEIISDVAADVIGEVDFPVGGAEVEFVEKRGPASKNVADEVSGVRILEAEAEVATERQAEGGDTNRETILANAGKEGWMTVSSPETADEKLPIETAEKTMEIVRQEEKIAGMLPEEKAVEIKVNVKNDKITAFEDKKLVTPLVENVDTDEAVKESDGLMSAENGNAPMGAKEADLSKITAWSEMSVNVADTAVSAAGMGDKGEVFSIQALSTGDPVRASSAAGVKFSSDGSPADVRNEGLSREVAEQIKVNITRFAVRGVDKIEIQLKPADLGRLEIKMQIAKDGTLHAHIIASNAETLDILQKDLNTLKEAFNNAGYQTEDGSFSFGYRGEEQNNNEREQLRTFIGEVISRDVEEEMAANDYIGVDGVNIRV